MSRIGSFLTGSASASGIASSSGFANSASGIQGPSTFDSLLQSAQQIASPAPAAGGETTSQTSDSSASSGDSTSETDPQSSPASAQIAPSDTATTDSDNTKSTTPTTAGNNSSKATTATGQGSSKNGRAKLTAKAAATDAAVKPKSAEDKPATDGSANSSADDDPNASNPLTAQAAAATQADSAPGAPGAGDATDSKGIAVSANAKSAAKSADFLPPGTAQGGDASAPGAAVSASAKGKAGVSPAGAADPAPATAGAVTTTPPPDAANAATIANDIASNFSAVLGSHLSQTGAEGVQGAAGGAAHAPGLTPLSSAAISDTNFVSSNYPSIVQGVHGQLLPNGGSMQISLSPPELGDLQLNVQMRDGALSAVIQTTTDTASRLLGHNLNELKSSLEGAGVTVEKLQVSQAPRNQANNSDQSQQEQRQSSAGNEQTQRDAQRREMLRRMWRRVSGNEELDLVA